MPQGDYEGLVSVCGAGSNDRKITCETLADDGDGNVAEQEDSNPSDYPPESFWLSKDAEFDWFDRNAFYERKGSLKGSLNNPNSNSSSQRFSMNLKKSKASIIGFPKPQKSCFTDAKHRRNHANPRLFPKRHEPAGKSAVLMTEPSSPNVSCIGRVRSKRDRHRRLRNRKVSSGSDLVDSKPEIHRKKGLWKNLRAMFRSMSHEKKKKKIFKVDKAATFPSSEGKKVTREVSDDLITEPAPAQPPSLGGMTRFVSGRRSDSWVGDVDSELDSIKSEPLNRGPVWKRRVVGPPEEVDCSCDWESMGPASV